MSATHFIIGTMHVRLGDLAGWVTAVGTVGSLAALTVARIRDRAEARDQHRRAQAQLISGWYGGTERRTREIAPDQAPPSKMYVLNRSDAPVYRVVVTLAFLSGTPPKTGEEWVRQAGSMPFGKAFGSVPPGKYRIDVDSGWAASGARPGVEVAFTDAAGRNWIRRADGRLNEIAQEAMTHYGVSGYFSLEGIDSSLDPE